VIVTLTKLNTCLALCSGECVKVFSLVSVTQTKLAHRERERERVRERERHVLMYINNM
jgi:hypothetical protein